MANKEEKSQASALKEKLLVKREIGIKSLSGEEIKKADDFCDEYKKFLDNSKTEREAVESALEIAKKAGFTQFDPNKKYSAGDKVYVINRKKNIILAVIGTQGAKDGVRLAIAHI